MPSCREAEFEIVDQANGREGSFLFHTYIQRTWVYNLRGIIYKGGGI
jgi:hypothetical protein